jgi:hypothetical protein
MINWNIYDNSIIPVEKFLSHLLALMDQSILMNFINFCLYLGSNLEYLAIN